MSFVLRAAVTAERYCVGAPNACSNQWLTVIGPENVAIAIDAPCQTKCSDCQPVGCPTICALPNPLPAEGVQRAWDGTYYAPSTCGAQTACARPTCAPSGHYTARMCAYAELSPSSSFPGCSSVPNPTCTEVGFDWPPSSGSATVEGTIGAAPEAGTDAGGSACCPSLWRLVSCTYADGGAGFACHNPAMGCASSTTCGEGCDRVVSGPCPE